MRILFVASNIICPGAHGGSTHVTEVVTRLRAEDEVLLIARKGSTLPQTLAIGLPTPSFGRRHWTMLRLLARAWRAARDFKPEVIYDRGSSFGLGSAIGRLLGVPVVCMVLDGHQTRLALTTAARIITTRPALVPAAYAAKITPVHWGANTTLFRPNTSGEAARTRLGIGSDRIVVCYTGGFYYWHGLEELVAAASRLRHLPITFLLVGDGERHEAIRRKVRDAGLDEAFIFTGRVEYANVPELVAAADICVAPYQPNRRGAFIYEPLKVFEYLAAGKATITLRCETLSALFTDGVDLLMVPPRSADAISNAIARLAADGDERARLGAAGRRVVEQRYSWDAHVAQLRRVFDEVRGATPAAAGEATGDREAPRA